MRSFLNSLIFFLFSTTYGQFFKLKVFFYFQNIYETNHYGLIQKKKKSFTILPSNTNGGMDLMGFFVNAGIILDL